MITRFRALFQGLERAHGSSRLLDKISDKGKVEAKSWTIYSPDEKLDEYWNDIWSAHLAGVAGIGVAPLRDDSNLLFAAIDVDIYDNDYNYNELAEKVTDLPIVWCETKSNGRHAYIFFKKPTSARSVRQKLKTILRRLGLDPMTEIFPKQSRLLSKKDIGNWINMPYAGDKRWCILEGKRLTAKEFLDHAESMRTDILSLDSDPTSQQPDIFYEGPPCLQCIYKEGGQCEGARNTFMLNVGVYLKKRWGEEWLNHLSDYNQDPKVISEPLTVGEVRSSIVKSLTRKDYDYTCSQEPLASRCNRTLCRQREFGVGGETGIHDDFEISDLIKHCTNPPRWVLSVNDEPIELTTQELLTPRLFEQQVVSELNIMPPQFRPKQWRTAISALLDNVTEVPAPEDAGPLGVFQALLEAFCLDRSQAKTMEELLVGKPFNDKGRTYFRFSDLLRYLSTNRFIAFTPDQIWIRVKDRYDAKSHDFKLKGRKIRCWSITSFEDQTEDFALPEIKSGEF